MWKEPVEPTLNKKVPQKAHLFHHKAPIVERTSSNVHQVLNRHGLQSRTTTMLSKVCSHLEDVLALTQIVNPMFALEFWRIV